jgi:hypothetical protein
MILNKHYKIRVFQKKQKTKNKKNKKNKKQKNKKNGNRFKSSNQ